jgi:hypothetical protein
LELKHIDYEYQAVNLLKKEQVGELKRLFAAPKIANFETLNTFLVEPLVLMTNQAINNLLFHLRL